ncbi:MAG TPA: DUF1707 domain-containing protein [Streptosporangiaceae bacterium]|nr:DUF1707 domain-containing protein [Streptosporangiaceae bacterium]
MGTNARDFPPGELRVSDGDRDRALSELSEAYQAGRITAEEFDHRSTQALSARTGRELAALLADLPLHGGPVGAARAATAPLRRADGYLVSRLTIGASLTAICFGGVAVTNALHPGVGGSAVLTPATVAVLCVVLVIVLRIRARAGGA